MATPIALKVENRKTLGTRGNRRLRNTGVVPGVIYGHHQDVLPVQLSKKELSAHLAHGVHVFTLDLGGKTESVLVKDVQYDYRGDNVIHVDFARVDLNERVEVSVSIELKGDPIGEKDGGVLQATAQRTRNRVRRHRNPRIDRHRCLAHGQRHRFPRQRPQAGGRH